MTRAMIIEHRYKDMIRNLDEKIQLNENPVGFLENIIDEYETKYSRAGIFLRSMFLQNDEYLEYEAARYLIDKQ